jgi:membrane associated rhomboid family serine protease
MIVGFLAIAAVPGALRQVAFVPAELASRPWTVFTYPFAQAAPLPFLLNLAALALLAPRLESRAGSVRLAAWFAAGAGGGALAALVLEPDALAGPGPVIVGLLIGIGRLGPAEAEPGSSGMRSRVLAAALATAALLPPLAGQPADSGRGILAGALLLALLVRPRRAAKRAERRVEPPNSHFNPPGVVPPGPIATPWDDIDPTALHEVNRSVVESLLLRARQLGPSHLTPSETTLLDRMAAALRLSAGRHES